MLLSMLAFLTSNQAFAFGAIAVDDEVGETDPSYGFVTGEETREAAQRKALKYCKEYGGEDCRVVVWFKQCGAYAASKKYYGYGYGPTKAKATSDALEMCGKNSCKLVVAECE